MFFIWGSKAGLVVVHGSPQWSLLLDSDWAAPDSLCLLYCPTNLPHFMPSSHKYSSSVEKKTQSALPLILFLQLDQPSPYARQAAPCLTLASCLSGKADSTRSTSGFLLERFLIILISSDHPPSPNSPSFSELSIP